MVITYDAAKNQRNIEERGLSFELAAEFDFPTALFALDERKNYNEPRIRALGKLRDRVHALVFIFMANGIRVISLRKANAREVKQYETYARS